MLLLINMTLKKINILEYAFGEGEGGHQKAYAVYAFINVDNCERPLNGVGELDREISHFCVLDPHSFLNKIKMQAFSTEFTRALQERKSPL